MSDKIEKSCGAVVVKEVDHQLSVLVIRQNQGHWCFPKGHVEKKETDYETACREVKEETGIKIQILEGFQDQVHYYPKANVYKDVYYYLAIPVGGKEKVQKSEVAELQWLPLSKAGALITYENDQAVLKHAIRYIKEHDVFHDSEDL